MDREASRLRVEFVGEVVRYVAGGVVYCNAEPRMGTVQFGPHGCAGSMEAGDEVVLYSIRRGRDGPWEQLLRFCGNCHQARELPAEARQVGTEQAVVSGTLERFEGVVHGSVRDDAVRLVDVEVLAYSSESDGA